MKNSDKIYRMIRIIMSCIWALTGVATTFIGIFLFNEVDMKICIILMGVLLTISGVMLALEAHEYIPK